MAVKMTRDRIKELRKARGWKQADLAKTIGVSEGLVASWETGRRVPHGPSEMVLRWLLEGNQYHEARTAAARRAFLKAERRLH